MSKLIFGSAAARLDRVINGWTKQVEQLNALEAEIDAEYDTKMAEADKLQLEAGRLAEAGDRANRLARSINMMLEGK